MHCKLLLCVGCCCSCLADRQVVYHANPGEDAAVQTWVSSCGLVRVMPYVVHSVAV